MNTCPLTDPLDSTVPGKRYPSNDSESPETGISIQHIEKKHNDSLDSDPPKLSYEDQKYDPLSREDWDFLLDSVFGVSLPLELEKPLDSSFKGEKGPYCNLENPPRKKMCPDSSEHHQLVPISYSDEKIYPSSSKLNNEKLWDKMEIKIETYDRNNNIDTGDTAAICLDMIQDTKQPLKLFSFLQSQDSRKIQKLFICSFCSKVYQDEKSMIVHVSYCNKQSAQVANQHGSKSSSKELVICNNCKVIIPDGDPKVLGYLSIKDSDDTVISAEIENPCCKICGCGTSSKVLVENHVKSIDMDLSINFPSEKSDDSYSSNKDQANLSQREKIVINNIINAVTKYDDRIPITSKKTFSGQFISSKNTSELEPSIDSNERLEKPMDKVQTPDIMFLGQVIPITKIIQDSKDVLNNNGESPNLTDERRDNVSSLEHVANVTTPTKAKLLLLQRGSESEPKFKLVKQGKVPGSVQCPDCYKDFSLKHYEIHDGLCLGKNYR